MLAGGLNAGMDRNYLEKRQDRKDLQDLVPKLKYQQDQEKYQQEQKQRDLQNQYYAVRPDVLQQNADTASRKVDVTAQKNAADSEYKQNVLTFGKDKADKIYQLRQRELDLKSRGLDQTDEMLKIRQQIADETARHNQTTEKQAATNEQGKMTRQQIGIAAKAAADGLKMAVQAGNMERAAQLRKELEDYKNQLTTPQ